MNDEKKRSRKDIHPKDVDMIKFVFETIDEMSKIRSNDMFNEFMCMSPGKDLELSTLRETFKTHCVDYMEAIESNKKSFAVEFCLIVLQEVWPEAKAERGTVDKVWKFTFMVGGDKHFVFVCTLMRHQHKFRPENHNNTMILSVNESALIIHDTLSRIVQFGVPLGTRILTPLAGACFYRGNLDELAIELKLEMVDLIISINQSLQADGHYLPKADVDIAICAFIAVTKNEHPLKKSILAKIIKQYMLRGHIPNRERIKIISKYITVSVSADFSSILYNDHILP